MSTPEVRTGTETKHDATAEANRRLVTRLYTEYLNTGRLDRLDEVIAPDYVGANDQRGPKAFAATVAALREAFPDLAYTVDDLVAEGDRVAVRWTWRGTHERAFRTFAPTGKRITSAGFAIFQIADGKLVRAWVDTDRLGFLLQIGAVPYNPAFGPPPAGVTPAR